MFTAEVFDFLILIKNKSFSHAFLEFFKLPVPVVALLLFYFFLFELVFFCTFLINIPIIKKKLIEKYKDPLIIKKRGYNTLSNSIRRTVILSLPLAAGILTVGYCVNHSVSVNAVIENNRRVMELYAHTRDKTVLRQMQKIPTGGFSERVYSVGGSFKDFFVSWGTGSRTKD